MSFRISRPEAYDRILELILAGKFAAAQTELDLRVKESDHPSFRELESLMEFQLGKLRTPKPRQKSERILWWLLVNSLVARVVFGIWIRVFYRSSKFEALYWQDMPEIIHFRYTQFERGLIQSMRLYQLSRQTPHRAEKYYLHGLVGHFFCMSGNFTIGLKKLKQSKKQLDLLFEKDSGPLIRQWSLKISAICALQTSYAGYFEESVLLYEQLFKKLEKHPYLWVELFARSMRLYQSLEQLDAVELRHDVARLKGLLGATFADKYALRTSTYSALLAALQEDFVLAQEQLLEADRFYSRAHSTVELGRCHFLRSLAELELGHSTLARAHVERAVAFLELLPGAVYHKVDAELMSIEIRLRSLLVEPVSENQEIVLRTAEQSIQACEQATKGAPAVQARSAVLRALIAYLRKDYALAAGLADRLNSGARTLSPRLALVLSQFDPNPRSKRRRTPSSLDTFAHSQHSLLESFSEMMSTEDLLCASSAQVRKLFGGTRCDVREVVVPTGGEANCPAGDFQISENKQNTILVVFSPQVNLEFTIYEALVSPGFDKSFDKTLRLLARMLVAEIGRRRATRDERAAALGNLAAQVAHDIKSPLTALEMVLRESSQLPEALQGLARASFTRIQDISNQLLSSNRGATTDTEVLLLADFVTSLVSEKRFEVKNGRVSAEIVLNLSEVTRDIYVKANRVEFARLFSNLINNSLEALQQGSQKNPKIEVSLSLIDGEHGERRILLRIVDNGVGIPPQVLPLLGTRGASFGKKNGTGLGIFHARSVLQGWGGSFEIQSQEGVGTQVLVALTVESSPAWIAREIMLDPEMPIWVLDDDDSIFQIWEMKLKAAFLGAGKPLPELRYFPGSECFLREVRSRELLPGSVQIFCDHKLGDEILSGLDVLAAAGLDKGSLLVTSRHDEVSIIKECARRGIGILPKNLISKLEISIGSKFDTPPATVLLDDDPLMHLLWSREAREFNIPLQMFSDAESFYQSLGSFSKETPFYIDSNLGSGVSGQSIAQDLLNKGYTEVYMATGYGPERFAGIPGLKGILSKTPPWRERLSASGV